MPKTTALLPTSNRAGLCTIGIDFSGNAVFTDAYRLVERKGAKIRSVMPRAYKRDAVRRVPGLDFVFDPESVLSAICRMSP